MFSKALGQLLTEFGKEKELSVPAIYDRIEKEIMELKPKLKGPNKAQATRFLGTCKKCKDKKELLQLITEAYFKSLNMGSDDF